VVTTCIGTVPDDRESPAWTTLLDSLEELGKYGQRIGAVLAAQTVNQAGGPLSDLLETLPEGTLGVDFDPASLMLHGFSPADSLRALKRSVLHVRARDASHDLATRRVVETPVGQGSLDFPELLAILEEADYRGYFTIERSGGEASVRNIQLAMQYLKSL
jgi:sugar phosphate isomerase/epimerase